jgi:hypothetical protein
MERQMQAQLKLTNSLNHVVEIQAKQEEEFQRIRIEMRQEMRDEIRAVRRDMQERDKKLDTRFRQLDERITKLVSGMGEFIRRRNGK